MNDMTQHMTQDDDEATLEDEITTLIVKQAREGLTRSELARFLELTAQRSMRKRPSVSRHYPSRWRISHSQF